LSSTHLGDIPELTAAKLPATEVSIGDRTEKAWSLPRVSLYLPLALALTLTIVKLLDVGFVELNKEKRILPGVDVTLMPYEDVRFTMCNNALLQLGTSPEMIFTGDSRTWNGIDPEIIARQLGVQPEDFFNFGTSSQVVSFTREIFLPHLLSLPVRPRYLVFGVTPDWLLARPNYMGLVQRHRDSLAYRLSHAANKEEDPVELSISGGLARHLALYRYRTDLVYREIAPDAKCWLLRMCTVKSTGGEMPFKEQERLGAVMTKYGWGPQAWDSKLSGLYPQQGPPRFTEQDQVDQENLIGLIRDTRQAGIIPIFVMMPLHSSFQQVHQPLMADYYRIFETIAGQQGVDVIYSSGDYSNPKLFVDGHHLSRLGAATFSSDLAHSLARYINGRGTVN
jgi:hypothetical protein